MAASDSLRNDFFFHVEGLAPYSYHMTVKALSFIDKLSRFKRIADIGCGKGLQTFILSEATNSQIIAVDFIIDYIEYLEKELSIQKQVNRIFPVYAASGSLPFYNEEFDMIWSESIANKIGFEHILKKWNKYIKKNGYISVCSYCWLTDSPPGKITEYWGNKNNEIASISNRIIQLKNAGFTPIAHFVMPDECWWNYFCPLEDNFNKFLQRHPNNPDAEKLIEEIDKEIDLYEKYGEHYGYVFFIGKKMRN